MEMQQIRYFIAAADTLNFTQAAKNCNVTQPALSRAIKNLEKEFGGSLFRRERSLSHLTNLGRSVLPLLTQCYNSAIAAKTLAKSYKSISVLPLKIAISLTVDIRILLPFLAELANAFLGVQFQFFRGDSAGIAARLKSGGSEIAIAGPLIETWDRLDTWTLFEEGYALVVSKDHPLAMRGQIGFQEMSDLRLIARPYCEQASQIEQLLRAGGIEQRAGDDILSDQDMLSLIDANIGAAIMPQSALGMANLHGSLVDGLSLTREVNVYAVAGRPHSVAATAFMNLLRAADWSTLSRTPHSLFAA